MNDKPHRLDITVTHEEYLALRLLAAKRGYLTLTPFIRMSLQDLIRVWDTNEAPLAR